MDHLTRALISARKLEAQGLRFRIFEKNPFILEKSFMELFQDRSRDHLDFINHFEMSQGGKCLLSGLRILTLCQRPQGIQKSL
jgi:hypothetical protein